MKLKHNLMPLLFCLLCAVFLWLVSGLMDDLGHREAAREELMVLLLPGSTEFTVEEYSGEDGSIVSLHRAEVGAVVEVCVPGYVDDITLLVGVRDNGRVSGLTVLDSHETPGLGQRIIHDAEFLRQFLRTDGVAGESIDALTGATVTTKAVTKAVNAAVAAVTGADTVTGATEWEG